MGHVNSGLDSGLDSGLCLFYMKYVYGWFLIKKLVACDDRLTTNTHTFDTVIGNICGLSTTTLYETDWN